MKGGSVEKHDVSIGEGLYWDRPGTGKENKRGGIFLTRGKEEHLKEKLQVNSWLAGCAAQSRRMAKRIYGGLKG